MKTWTIPVATAQQFAANDYVSACTATIECDVPLNGYYRYILKFDEPFHTYDGKTITQMNYNPCGYEHDVDINGELIPITITHGRETSSSSPAVELAEPINCYFFAEYTESGLLKNAHCTLNADGFQSNKS